MLLSPVLRGSSQQILILPQHPAALVSSVDVLRQGGFSVGSRCRVHFTGVATLRANVVREFNSGPFPSALPIRAIPTAIGWPLDVADSLRSPERLPRIRGRR